MIDASGLEMDLIGTASCIAKVAPIYRAVCKDFQRSAGFDPNSDLGALHVQFLFWQSP